MTQSHKKQAHKKMSAKAIAAVNAVEGLYLSPESKARLMELEGLSVEAQIKAIREAYRKQSA